jgi:hypothetical protein
VVLELVDVVDVATVVVVEIGLAISLQTFFGETSRQTTEAFTFLQTFFWEANRQTTGTFIFLTWMVDVVPSFRQI